MKNALATGIYEYLPDDEYHNDVAVGSTSLKTIVNKTPLHLHGGIKKESTAFEFGKAFHMAILEPSRFEIHVIKGPDDRRGNKWKDLKDECDAKSHVLLTSGDYDICLQARDAAHKSETIRNLCTPLAKREQSYFWTDKETGIRCKARVDLDNSQKNVIVDLKTCVSASPYVFAKAVADYGYHLQAAMYKDGIFDLTGRRADFLFIAVEKEAPFATAIYCLDDVTQEEGQILFRHALEKYALCKKFNSWPGYGDDIQKIRIPAYAFKMCNPEQFPAMSGKATLGA